MTETEFLGYLHAGEIGQMFLECFWDNPTTRAPYAVDDTVFAEVAQKKGYRVYVAKVAKLPDSAQRRQFDAKLRKRSQDYLAVYVSTVEPFHHLWSIPVKAVDRRQLVTIEYVQDDQAMFLLEKVRALKFGDNDEPTILDVVEKANKTFLVNTEDVTKKFYQGFKKMHDAFVKGIVNLGAKNDREWYASVMLNRLMFCYFIQKKRFLNFDENYLGNKLKEVQGRKGQDKFYESFYRSFLKQLFSDGLDKPIVGRSEYFLKKYGRIPYLNGGMFSQHQIEKENKDIDIPDKVFESLFAFFDQWHWHLDNRITASGRDINPDVLGYIFEQYINDRAQMGAYYTKEDITEYIGRNCIVPYLFEAVKKADARPFAKGGEVWSLLKASGDDYIFPAVKKGVDLPLPANVERGVSTEGRSLRERRSDWNKPADEPYALPTEIWRETVARRQRCRDVRAKIKGGEITDIHDFITYNLDIRAFAEDVIRKTGDHRLVLHFYKALREVTVLDPTCGSGAFLFAALNILEPLYEACLDRMEDYHAANKNLFKGELDEIAGKFRSNRQYFIYKNIILRNLYGVDIMHEATEIARLWLFLKMVAVVDVDPYDDNLGLDPLPDIDFNVRCGNTLVGYATEKEVKDGLVNGDMFAFAELKDKIDTEMEKVSTAYDFFLREQLKLTGDHQQLADAKREVAKRLAAMRTLLDDQLYDRHSGKKKADWLRDTQPFHWYTEFYPIMHGRGGFDVIIGNPPYVEKRGLPYSVKFTDREYSNLFADCLERVRGLIRGQSHFGMIVPMSLTSIREYKPLRIFLCEQFRSLYFTNHAIRPFPLFTGVSQRVTIVIGSNATKETALYTSNYLRTNDASLMLRTFTYWEGSLDTDRDNLIAKIGSPILASVWRKLHKDTKSIAYYKSYKGASLYFKDYGESYWVFPLNFVPYLTPVKSFKCEAFQKNVIDNLFCVLNSSLFYIFHSVISDCWHFGTWHLFEFPCDLKNIIVSQKLVNELQRSYRENRITRYDKRAHGDIYEYKIYKSKPIIDKIDELLAKHYGFTEEELDFIINYDIKYRMGDELNAAE